MISSNDFRTGTTIELDGQVWRVIEFLHVKPGKGSAFVRTKLKNVMTGNVNERTFRAGETLPQAVVEKRDMQFVYPQGDNEYVFMDMESYEQEALTRETLGDGAKYLKEGMSVSILKWQERVIGVDLPNTVVLQVVETDPGVKGDTAQGGTKPAKVETGAEVMVPLFITIGEKIKIDTRDNSYLGREN
ncbi:elongation factor P [Gloeobacter violaceus]|uniref:Elongation factor P n=1 Tax=Gloeobacter violaceus (strain ATCC 29082 / PCC 7421) TaxID=251221 RepID=EFP_GLOVI|nr:elongation factor P [Gloeobacter violaceus]Q7NL41.1 RecName: Full=Elongation factor P; Short=EF-P [Gloeobacter violaceus PCC 7421]BAC89226.1 elongation factor P [Gloeobacter violaceus PCC 7421]